MIFIDPPQNAGVSVYQGFQVAANLLVVSSLRDYLEPTPSNSSLTLIIVINNRALELF